MKLDITVDPNVYGVAGIITVHLVDPLSSLISKLNRNDVHDDNAVGFYYQLSSKQTRVVLFNIYDNTPINYFSLDLTMEHLLISPFVDRINYYVLQDLQSVTFFRTSIISVLSDNSKKLSDKYHSYHRIFTKLIASENHSNVVTGYDLIWKVLSQFEPINSFEKAVEKRILSSKITISAAETKILSHELNLIIDQSRTEIVKLLAVFVDFYLTDDRFHNYIGKLNLQKNTKISNDENKTLTSLENFKCYLTTLIEKIQTQEIVEIQADQIIYHYNQLAQSLGKEQIIINDTMIHTKQAVVSLLNLSNSIESSPINETFKKIITSNSRNFDMITTQQLIDVLIYIDSLRTINGTGDVRFAGLQNAVTLELAKRNQQLQLIS